MDTNKRKQLSACGLRMMITSFAMLPLLSGCVDSDKNYFDPEATKAMYDEAYPVSDIDPDMDWKTTRSLTLNVAVEEDDLVNYRVRVYDGNPLFGNSSPSLLAEGNARKGVPFISSFDCPTAVDTVYVMRTDEHERHLLKSVAVENGAVKATFGTTGSATRSGATGATRATEADVPQYSPDRTEAEVKALIDGAVEFTDATSMERGKIYYIPAGKTVTRTANFGVGDSEIPLIVAGTLKIDNPGNTALAQALMKIYVLNGGKVNITSGSTFYLNYVNLTVYKGGEVSGGNLSVNNNNTLIYNAGTFTVDTFSNNGAVFYNDETGVATADYLNFNTYNCTFVNRGEATAAKTHSNIVVYNTGSLDVTDTFAGKLVNLKDVKIKNCTYYGTVIQNNCYTEIEGNFYGELTLGDGCALRVKGNMPAEGRTITLGSGAMLQVDGEGYLNSRGIYGPSTGSALIKIKKLMDANSMWSGGGTVYYEIDELDATLQSNFSWMTTQYALLTSGGSSIAKWGNSPFVMPSGDCTGDGSTPVESGTPVEDKDIEYTYAFEDNYPYVGDYDFNDVVLDVKAVNNRNDDNTVKSTTISVTLAAVGGIKKVGAGLRLVGINKSDVESVSFSGDTQMRNTLVNSLMENATMEENGTEVVIPLFGDAHAVYGRASDRPMLNTGLNSTGSLYTLNIEIVPRDKSKTDPFIGKDNLDFFVATTVGSGSRCEIHLYEFWDNGATANGNVYRDNLELAGNKTWAISVPNFRYPNEYEQITGVYDGFAAWAKNRKANEDWYNNPDTEKVYR